MAANVFIVLAIVSLCSSCRIAAAISANETDRLALLVLKGQLADPGGVLSSWNDSNNFCQWTGVSCSQRHWHRVTALDLSSRRLSGPISPFIANLTFLRAISLADNGFFGEIPPELGQLRRLQLLNLSSNSLHGEIPVNLSYCSNLRSLFLSVTQLSGRIPIELGSLSKLDTLSFLNNSISGPIPPSLGNLTSLASLSLDLNQMTGNIPEELGKLTILQHFAVAVNMLSGEIPPSIYNLTSLYYFDVAYNNLLTGSLPPSLGTSFPNLQFLFVAGNQLHGSIPASVTNMTNLVVFNIAFNNFTKTLPSNLGRLKGLRYVNIGVNQLTANSAADWKFMDSLSNCSNLQKLLLQDNMFGGILPQSVTNLSTQLQKLEMFHNQITGSIPSEIGNIVNLNTLLMHENLFTGTIPMSIGKLKNLYMLALFHNELRGRIPFSLGNLTQLLRLRLDENNLEGPIPPSLGDLKNLVEFDLSTNKLSGNIPREIFGLTYLSSYMDLSYNQLDGLLPMEVGSLTNVGLLLIRSNKLSGELPSSLGMCASLVYLGLNRNLFVGTIPETLGNLMGLKGLNLSQNNLSGPIPQSLSKLRGIQELYLSYNNLTGPFPEFIENLTSLTHLTLSFNHLQGEVPTNGIFRNATAIAVIGNDGLCGGIPELHLPSCPSSQTSSKRKWALMLKRVVIIVSVIVFFLLLTFFAYVCWKIFKRNLGSRPSHVSVLGEQFPKVSYRELVKATDRFSSTNLIGMGRYGSVYKGTLDGGKTFVAVKVFNLLERGASRSFLAECDALRNIRHRNLIKVLTTCSSSDQEGNDFKAIVFEYMPNRSLDAWLHTGEGLNDHVNNTLSLIQRLNIAIDVATALEYLHHNCQPHVIHCDLKPSNVLLDYDMGAHVGDFGIAKFYSEAMSKSFCDSSSSIGIRGTVGYVAPEYGAGGQVSTLGDVYSFGILILEMFTGKRPVDDMFKDGLTLPKYVEMGASFELVVDIADPLLLSNHGDITLGGENNTERKIEECLVALLRLGLECSSPSPGRRKSTRETVSELHRIKNAYVEAHLHGDRQNGEGQERNCSEIVQGA